MISCTSSFASVQMMFLLKSTDGECSLLLSLNQGKNGKVLHNKRQLQLTPGKTSAIEVQFLEVSGNSLTCSTVSYFLLGDLFIKMSCLFFHHSTCGKMPAGQTSAGMTSCQFFMT